MFETIIVSIISALATATLTYLGYWRQVQADLKKEYAGRFNEQKWKAYKGFHGYAKSHGQFCETRDCRDKGRGVARSI